MVPAPTATWLLYGGAGPIFHGQHRTAEHPDSGYAEGRYLYWEAVIIFPNGMTPFNFLTPEITSSTSHSYLFWS